MKDNLGKKLLIGAGISIFLGCVAVIGTNFVASYRDSNSLVGLKIRRYCGRSY